MAAFFAVRIGLENKAEERVLVLYSHAIRYEWITFNPISKVRTSSKRLREKDVLSPEEFQALLEQLSVRDQAMVLLAGSTGLRRSEMIALTWADVNTRTLEVNVLRSCVCNHFGNTKTECSRRPVPLHPLVLDALLRWREESLYRAEKDFLFPSIRLNGTKPLSPDSLLKRSIRPALARAGIMGKQIGWHNFPSLAGDEPAGDGCGHKGGAGTFAAREQPDNAGYLHAHCLPAEAGCEHKTGGDARTEGDENASAPSEVLEAAG